MSTNIDRQMLLEMLASAAEGHRRAGAGAVPVVGDVELKWLDE